MAKKEYGSDSIQSQSELEALRMYPNVYLGSNDLDSKEENKNDTSLNQDDSSDNETR